MDWEEEEEKEEGIAGVDGGAAGVGMAVVVCSVLGGLFGGVSRVSPLKGCSRQSWRAFKMMKNCGCTVK